ncbi:MAG: hypothetical protein ACK4NY_24745 [Spirosomataceae bacterium]
MKKYILAIILILQITEYTFAQVVMTPSHLGLGENTIQSIPFHIKYFSGQMASIEGPKTFFSISQYANPSATINTIYVDDVNDAGALKFKSASNIFTFYTIDQEQARLDLNLNRFTVQKEVTFEGDLSFGGAFRFNNNAGVNGDLMMSLGNGTPAWSTSPAKIPIGFLAKKWNQIVVLNGTETDFTSLIEEFDHEASLNFSPTTGVFIAPSDGVYHFDCLVPEINYSSGITNGRATLYVKKNNVIVDTMLKNFSGYGANNQNTISTQMSVTLKLTAGDSVKFGIVQVNNQSSSVTINAGVNHLNIAISGFKVY